MVLSLDAERQIRQDLLAKADVLAHYLSGLGATDAEQAKALLAEIVKRLEDAISRVGYPAQPLDRKPPAFVASQSRSDEIENFILDNLADNPRGQSVQDIVDRFEEAGIEIKRATLVVRLHRLVNVGKLQSRTHGHYALSEVERERRQFA